MAAVAPLEKYEKPGLQMLPISGCPPGLEYLVQNRKVRLNEIKSGCCERKRVRFDIFNDNNGKIMNARQDLECFGCSFKMPIARTIDNTEALYVQKDAPCCLADCTPYSFLCCPDLGLRVESPRGTIIGWVVLRLDEKCCDSCCKDFCGNCCKDCSLSCCKDRCGSCCKDRCDSCCKDCCDGCICYCCCLCICSCKETKLRMYVLDPERKVIMTINTDRECFLWCRPPCSDTVYSLRANNGEYIGGGEQIGSIRKVRPRCCSCPYLCGGTFCSYLDKYEVEFPLDLDVKVKAVVMSSVFFMKILGW